MKTGVSSLPRRTAAARAAPKAALQKGGPPAPPDDLFEQLGMIAHDLNNVFTAILMAVQLLREKASDEKTSRLLAVLEEHAARGIKIARQVRALDTGDAGGRPQARTRQAPRGK